MEIQVIIANTAKEREKAYAIRRRVFIEEQNVPAELELDEYDNHKNTQHVLLFTDKEKAVGTARFRPYGDGVLKIERVAVLAEQRGGGVGRMIMEAIETEARKAGYKCLKLSAQLHARKFYERLGYQSYGEVYLDAGIKHIAMTKTI
ncbi:MAG TPA: GNAT family N-acetyltransferase [Methylomusa anaerophila]|uniref:Putative N-acetyltransferase YjcF n=1 Tax=Methylomusa anaerophila TaxID=1930071 RepID=A0A348AK08_9FIRM|nr:GNAT family N-acetyltransferase [Methylomusa anaerophila]BBB91406.1 putative N-acetyltransferase YjcF [Methylomusa anaerophila]HML90169.1 GNAT family N-acetyltransferase [Methylomusa anaerophila]